MNLRIAFNDTENVTSRFCFDRDSDIIMISFQCVPTFLTLEFPKCQLINDIEGGFQLILTSTPASNAQFCSKYGSRDLSPAENRQ